MVLSPDVRLIPRRHQKKRKRDEKGLLRIRADPAESIPPTYSELGRSGNSSWPLSQSWDWRPGSELFEIGGIRGLAGLVPHSL